MHAYKSDARDAAKRLLASYWDEDSFPVDPFAIADELDIDVWLADLDPKVSGIFRKRPGKKPEIYVASSDAERRQRFTCAHELGHRAHLEIEGKLETDSDEAFVELRDQTSSEGTKDREVFANEFAANLLMPAVAVRALHRRGMDAISLARFFGVSPLSMEFRLKNLGLAR